MNILFLGGIFTEADEHSIIRNSKGVVQYAADTLQKNYIDGFLQSKEVQTVSIINLPFVGSYPNRYRKLFFIPVSEFGTLGRASIRNFKFLNLTLAKNLHRIVLAVRAILPLVDSRPGQRQVLVCYSMHLPFLLACFFAKLLRRDIHFCVIVPDLPEYMAVRKGISKFLFKMLSIVSYYVVGKSDTIVTITRAMLEKFDSDIQKVVIEGIADARYVSDSIAQERQRYYLYTGTLDRRYGIRNLLDSYSKSKIDSYDLYICGDGDDRRYVEQMAGASSRIKYFGQLDRESVLRLQRNATLLINPRDNDSEYTKYSFPSKIIEYMSSGVPVLMYRLDGIPEEYYEFCYQIPTGADGLMLKLLELSRLADEEFVKKGALAKLFIVERKMPGMQVGKLLRVIKGSSYV